MHGSVSIHAFGKFFDVRNAFDIDRYGCQAVTVNKVFELAFVTLVLAEVTV